MTDRLKMIKKAQEKNEELFNLIDQVKSGDSAAFSVLVKKYDPMLNKALHSYISDHMSREDIEDLGQEGLVAFYRAIISFDKTQSNVEFGLYAKICVTNSMISYKRGAVGKLNEVELVGEDMINNICDPDGEVPKLYEMRESERQLGEQIEKSLSQYENEVWSYYVNGCTTREIAVKLNCSEKSIDNAIFRIRKKLKTLLKI